MRMKGTRDEDDDERGGGGGGGGKRRKGEAYLHVVDRSPALRDCGTNDASRSDSAGSETREAAVNDECVAVRKACARAIGDNDMEIAEFMATKQEEMNRAKLTNMMCYEVNGGKGVCSGRGKAGDALARYKSLPKDLRIDEFRAAVDTMDIASESSSDASPIAGLDDVTADDEGRLKMSPFVMLNEEAVKIDQMIMDMQSAMPQGQSMNFEMKRREDILREMEENDTYGEL